MNETPLASAEDAQATISRACAHCGSPIPDTFRVDALYCHKRCGSRSRGKAWEAAHPDRVIAQRLTQNAKTNSRLFTRIKSRAKLAGIPFNLTRDDIVVPERCPILGCEFARISGQGHALWNSPSVDRRDPSLGYIKGNVGVISHRANMLKTNVTLPQLRAILAYVEAVDVTT